MIATSLLPSDIAEADRIREILRERGWPGASRSLVIREALARLAEDVLGKTGDEVFRDFITRQGRRLARS